MMLTLLAGMDQLSFISMLTTLSVVLTPKKCLAECVDALNDWFRVIKSIIDYLSGCHQILVNILCNWY